MSIYAAYNLNKDIRKNSSSGGIFYSLAKHILDQNGIVFGAAWNKDWLVDMCYIDKLKDLSKLMGSKYVKANNKNTFKECKEFLDSGRQVLYSGTPCQIYALKFFLKKEYNNLLTVSVACFGTTPTTVWKDYLKTIKRPDAKIIDINLRDKSNTDWNNYKYTIKYSDGKIISENHLNNKYSKAYISANYFNEACYKCIAKKELKSDISIGDFWGVQEALPNIDAKLGVSFIICNSSKGEKTIKALDDLKLEEINDINKVKKYNRGIQETPGTKEAAYNKGIFKKKVAIVTMNLHFNIGTALQAYALQKIILNNGYDCDVITWTRKDRLHFCDTYIKMRILPTAQDYNQIKESDYDIFVVGSDQIWRKNTSLKDYKENYINYPFLGFTANWNKVRFSYAASFGTSWQYNKIEDKKLTDILKQFNALSTRELNSVIDCKNNLGLDFKQHIDPTMLLNKEDYLKLCSNIAINNNKNIFKYILHETENKTDFINESAKKLGLPVVTHNKLYVVDWLAKMRDASLIITDSFHGVVFSIIFNKPFVYWNTRDGGKSRFETIEKLFNIQNRQIKDNFIITDDLLKPANIDLSSTRQTSLNYILKNLADVPQKLTFNLSQNKLNWQKNNKQAWMLFLSSDNYIYYVLNVYKNLLDYDTNYAVCCGYTEDVSQATIDILNKCGIITFKLNTKAILQKNIKLKGISNWIKAFTKLGLLKNQLNLDKMIYLDSDLGIYDNIDELFNKPHMSAVLDGAPLPNRQPGPYQIGDSVFCSGLFVWDFKNNKDADKLLQLLPNLPKDIEWHDQNVLNYYYKDWQDQKNLHLNYTYGLMTTIPKFKFVNPIRGKNWPKIIHYIAGQGEKTKIPFIDKKFYLQSWCDMLVVDEYYNEINNSIKALKQMYDFELPLINTKNIIHKNADKTAAQEETIKMLKLKEQKKDAKADGRPNTYLYF